MVRRGEYLERAVVLSHGARTLEGLYHRGSKGQGVLIAPAAPWEDDTMESAVVAELAWAITRAGHPTLRFNYAGVGASPGSRAGASTPGTELARLDPDLELALGHLRENLARGGEVGACGVGDSGLRLLQRCDAWDLSPLFLLTPDPRRLPREPPSGREVVLAYPQHWEPPDGDVSWRERVQEWAATLRQGHVAWIAQADPVFRRGLVELGQLAAHTFSPPGLLDLGEG